MNQLHQCRHPVAILCHQPSALPSASQRQHIEDDCDTNQPTNGLNWRCNMRVHHHNSQVKQNQATNNNATSNKQQQESTTAATTANQKRNEEKEKK